MKTQTQRAAGRGSVAQRLGADADVDDGLGLPTARVGKVDKTGTRLTRRVESAEHEFVSVSRFDVPEQPGLSARVRYHHLHLLSIPLGI